MVLDFIDEIISASIDLGIKIWEIELEVLIKWNEVIFLIFLLLVV
jgi:hypothetical protein